MLEYEIMKKTLHRSSKNKFIGGVCGGIAETYGFDATLVRLIFILLAIFSWGGPAILGYIVAWMIMPEEGETPKSENMP